VKNALGQEIILTMDARTAFTTFRDPRFQDWPYEDAFLANLVGRQSLPWAHDPGWDAWRFRVLYVRAMRDALNRFVRRSVAARKGWATRRAK